MTVSTQSLFLLAVASLVLLWGVLRYRRRFVKIDLYIAGTIALGIFLVGFFPTVYDVVGAALDIENRVVTMLLVGNLGFIAFCLYLLGTLRETRGKLGELTRQLSIDKMAAERTTYTDGGNQPTIHVVIPAYNEEKSIRTVVQSLPEVVLDHYVVPVVVSDGSADATASRARIEGAMVVEHPVNQGQGGALKTGFEIAAQADTDIVVTMDGDGQHPVEELERLVRPIVDGEADYVMGSRHKGVDKSGNGTVRRAGVRAFTVLVNTLTDADITDCTNGFRAIRGSDLERLTLTEERFSAPELIIEARKNGLRIREVPITVEERQAGTTKKPRLGYALGLTRTILTTWLR
ncbi:glycosyltransferase family 2 protein [Halomarina halobia]|uniref:glycosyltransferase family 2 protein n=1 Tax=Halomarina halobia TaxID=3033386 RepID=UPI0023E7954E|nr:glycosyltransferase family 2 protein [Halomarina sp. PSR21]